MKINFKKLNHVQLCIPVGKEEEAREFYGSFLGLKEIEKPKELKSNGGLWFEIGDIQLHIGIEEKQNKSKFHPAFEVDELDKIEEFMKQNNIEIRQEIMIPNLRRFSFYDPFGNRIELMEFSKNVEL